MRRKILVLVALLAGCSEDDGEHFTLPDASPPPGACVQANTREKHTITVSGSILDWGTLDPVPAAQVEMNTAWDVIGNWPDGCPPLATLTTDAGGNFGPVTVEVGSIVEPPILFYRITGAGIAPTASDARATNCLPDTADCGSQYHLIRVPTEALATAWRAELESGGMPGAATRGLVLFTYWDTNYGTAPDVTPLEGPAPGRNLIVDTEVRFLQDDDTIAPAGQAVTLDSGAILVGLDTTAGEASIGGQTQFMEWDPTGVLIRDGWIFVEDKSAHVR